MIKEINKHEAEELLIGTKYIKMIHDWLGILPREFNDDYVYYLDTEQRTLNLYMKLVLRSGNEVEVPLFKFEELVIDERQINPYKVTLFNKILDYIL